MDAITLWMALGFLFAPYAFQNDSSQTPVLGSSLQTMNVQLKVMWGAPGVPLYTVVRVDCEWWRHQLW